MEMYQFGKTMCRQTLRTIRCIRHLDKTIRRIMDNPAAWNKENESTTTHAIACGVAEVMINVLSMRMAYPACLSCVGQMDEIMISLRNTCSRMDQLAGMVRVREHREVVRAAVDEMRSNSWIQA